MVVDRRIARRPLAETLPGIVEAGVDWIQIRERELGGEELLAWAAEMVEVAGDAELIVNRRVDVALCLGARGVHLGFDAMAPGDARELLGGGTLIGISAHAPEEVAAAARAGASYAHLAPIFSPLSKRVSSPPLGLEKLSSACAHGLPVLAQGGIDAARAARAVAAGAAGVAVTGAILMDEDPAYATIRLRRALDQT